MSRRAPILPIVLALIVVGGAIFWLRKPTLGKSAPTEPLAACPANAFLVARADVAALRKTVLGDTVDPIIRALVPFPRAAADAPCGVDPAARLDTVALVVPDGDERNDLGLALKLRVTDEELSRCQAALAPASVRTRSPEWRGPFAIFASGDARADTFAIATSGLAVVAPRTWADAMIDVADGKKPSAAVSPPHADLLGAAKGRGAQPRALIVSVALPRATRERVRRDIEADLPADSDERRSMEGVLGVEAIAAAADVAADTEIVVEMRCEAAGACASVKELVERKRKTWSASPVVRLIGLGQASDSLTLTLEGARLSAKTRLPTADLRGALERLVAWRTTVRSSSSSKGDAGP